MFRYSGARRRWRPTAGGQQPRRRVKSLVGVVVHVVHMFVSGAERSGLRQTENISSGVYSFILEY